jgi:phosphoglycerol transferase MdoB-like AlkP superfamily enzyme
MLFFLSVLLTTILITVITERFIKPKATVFSVKTLALHSTIITIIFLALTLIVQRPIFSALTVMIFFIIVVAVNNTKFTALKEPLVFSDFAMFAQAFKHPRLYFGFLGLAPVIIATVIIVGLIISVLKLEPAMAFTWQRILSTFIAITIALYVSSKIALSLKLSTNIEDDNASFGLVNTLYSYFIHSRTTEHQKQLKNILKTAPFSQVDSPPPPFLRTSCALTGSRRSAPTLSRSARLDDLYSPDNKPNITVIQSESFFDARRLHPSIKTSVLENFDKINAESSQYGKLKVPAWGANTMRTEFSFLTGIQNKDLGFYRYYPYQFLAKYQLPSIASTLKNQGYYCVCIHPHPASFFGRDHIFPKMGFDEFIDIEDFQQPEKFGPYVSDETVTNKIIEITKEKTDKPLFIFVITMENHGPLHLEKTSKQEQAKYYNDKHSSNLPEKLNDLTVYLRHLKNADTMIKMLTDEYKSQTKKSNKETLLCFYGDHVPSMPITYQATNYHDENSDYFIWNSKSNSANKQQTISIESLACGILRDV